MPALLGVRTRLVVLCLSRSDPSDALAARSDAGAPPDRDRPRALQAGAPRAVRARSHLRGLPGELMPLSREQIGDLSLLERLSNEKHRHAQLVDELERRLWASGVSPAQLELVTGEPKWRIRRRMKGEPVKPTKEDE